MTASKNASADRSAKAERIVAYAICLIISALALGICSRSSPLYPINDWVDSNCFFTVGKAMFSGKTLYLDIYEQKGIFLYFLHGIAYLISNTSFLGVYFIEVLSFSAFLYLTYLIARSFASRIASLAVLAPLSLALLCTRAFCQGDSAEQLMLPLLLYPVYCLIKSSRQGKGGLPSKIEVAIIGAAFALVLLTKFTLVGVFFGYVLALAVLCLIKKDVLSLLRFGLLFCAGAGVAFLPFFIYFVATGSLSAFFEVYFYNNLFLYPIYEEQFTIWENLIYSFGANAVCFSAAVAGLVFVVAREKRREVSIALPSMAFFTVLFIYVGGRFHEYYPLGALFFSALGFAALAPLFELFFKKLFKKEKKRLATSIISLTLACVTCLSLCLVFSENAFLIGTKKEDTWQYKFAEIIERSDEKTLINYGSLDLGLYTAANIVPSERFFCHLNIDLAEMEEAIDQAVLEKRAKFVVYRGNYPPLIVMQNYKIVCREISHLEFEGSRITYFLLERKEASIGTFE